MDTAPPSRDPTAPTAAFLAGIVGILGLALALERLAARPEPVAERVEPDADLTHWSARELRALPGLGEKRAVEIVRARWDGRITGDAESLDRVEGIGPETVARVRTELARRPWCSPYAARIPPVIEP
ncbi:MAG: helix-hairpin-helix domain-containing protein [Planctomycetes bacterium]|nr:helix-hairpin-helix domain-containing protein [Planctomycetota bacterium]